MRLVLLLALSALVASAGGYALGRARPDPAIRPFEPRQPDVGELMVQIRWAVRQEVAGACSVREPPAPQPAPEPPPAAPPEPTAAELHAFDAAVALVDEARWRGHWGEEQIQRLRSLLLALTPAQRQEAIGHLVRAVNAQQIALDVGQLL